MGTEDFHCPKCSQLNTINRTTCKNCGADLTEVLDGIEPMAVEVLSNKAQLSSILKPMLSSAMISFALCLILFIWGALYRSTEAIAGLDLLAILIAVFCFFPCWIFVWFLIVMTEKRNMGTEDFPCPKCSQLNTTRRITCKNCGAVLKEVVDGIKHEKKATGHSKLSIIKLVIKLFLAFILISLVSMCVCLKFISLGGGGREYYEREVGSALSSTIMNKHADYLTNRTPYTASDVVADTQYSGGITATTGEPRDGQFSAVSPTAIRLIYKNKVYEWDYIPRNGDTPASLRETGDNW